MNGRPVRGGCKSRVLVALAVIPVLAGCLFMGADEGSSTREEGGPNRPIATSAPVQPALCGGETLLSGGPGDTGTPLTEDQMLAHVMVGFPKPEDYLTQTVVVDEGFGSFSLSAPAGFSAFWRAGTSPDILLELSEPMDEEWSAFWEERMVSGDTNTRAIMVDGEQTDGVSAVHVTLTEAYPETGGALADRVAQDYSEGGGAIGERCAIRANGGNGAYVEHTVPGELLDGEADRTEFQFLIPDDPNDLLWGVTCDVPRTTASAEVKETCREIASTFRPLPAVVR